MIPALILAAGASSRMGRPKGLLPAEDPSETFLSSLVAAFRGAGAAPLVVVRPGDAALREEAVRAGAVVIDNPLFDRGQLSSVQAGLRAVSGQGPAAVIVTPVDVPRITAATITRLLQAARESDALVIRPVHEGRHGHPVVFKAAVFGELLAADPALGAREVVRRDPGRVLDVTVETPEVTEDVDTTEDYERIFRRTL